MYLQLENHEEKNDQSLHKNIEYPARFSAVRSIIVGAVSIMGIHLGYETTSLDMPAIRRL